MNVMCHSEITPCDGMNQSKANVMNVMCQSGAKQSRLFISNDDTIRTALERDNDDDASVDV